MPELPEVEVILRGLKPHLENQKVTKFGASNKKLRFPLDLKTIQQELTGNTVAKLHRRAKYICITFDNRKAIVAHLGMTGNFGFFDKRSPRAKHDHFWCELANGKELRYNDTRRFGSIQFVENLTKSEKELFHNLGPEPLSDELNGEYLQKQSARKTVAIKNFIMDNRVVVGVGNIYANESLFLSGIAPTKSVKNITKKEWHTLAQTIKDVLRNAIECGGSTISDFVNSSGESGYFQMNFKVYGKSNQKCPNCKTLIKHLKIGGRASYYCSNCQK